MTQNVIMVANGKINSGLQPVIWCLICPPGGKDHLDQQDRAFQMCVSLLESTEQRFKFMNKPCYRELKNTF